MLLDIGMAIFLLCAVLSVGALVRRKLYERRRTQEILTLIRVYEANERRKNGSNQSASPQAHPHEDVG